jgi:RHS repeat-associated protein
MQALLGYGHTSAATNTQQNLAYTYDNLGNIKTITDTIWTGSRSFDYDDLNRLTQATGTFGGTTQTPVSQTYSYDAIGNILTKAGVSYCYGYMAGCSDTTGLSRVKSTFDGATTTNYDYDFNGNVLTGAGRTITWNKDNRLDTVNASTGSAVMSYDYTGIRVKKSGSTGTTYFPFSGYEVQGSQVTKYIKMGNEIIASKKGSSRFFYHNDHLGGVNIISDINAGQVQLNEYDPWGKVSRSETVSNPEPTHRFTGQEFDSESGIHYYGGRYYDQNIARFISPDPFVQDPDDPQNLNRYAYVLNQPAELY